MAGLRRLEQPREGLFLVSPLACGQAVRVEAVGVLGGVRPGFPVGKLGGGA